MKMDAYKADMYSAMGVYARLGEMIGEKISEKFLENRKVAKGAGSASSPVLAGTNMKAVGSV